MTKLNPRHKLFADLYIKNGRNGSKAALDAGYAENSAPFTASEILARPEVKEYVNSKLEKLSEKIEISAEKILQEYAKIAFYDLRKLYTEEGGLKDINNMDDVSGAVLAGVETHDVFEYIGDQKVNIGTIKKVKVHNKLKALQDLGRHLKLFVDVQEQDLSDELKALFKTIMKK